MSTAFKDSEGREWILKITGASAERILELAKIDIYSEDDGLRLIKEPRVALAAGGAVLSPEIQRRSLTTEQFLDGLDGDAIWAAHTALQEALVNFSPPEFRATRMKILDKIKSAVTLRAKREEQRIDGGKFDKLIAEAMDAEDRKVDEQLGNFSGNFADSSEWSDTN